MAATKPKAVSFAGPANKGLSIVSVSPFGVFRRAGFSFGKVATVVPLNELTDEQFQALHSESMLVVTEVDIDPAEA